MLKAGRRLFGVKEEKFPLIRDVKLPERILTRGLALAKSIGNIRDNKGIYRKISIF
jgi:hypothetical protein